MKLPAIQFYPGDWLRDDIAGCSLAAQGLWLRMMFIAHDSERYGYLCLNGKAMATDFIARRCGSSRDEYVTLLAELDSAGVPSRTPDDIIYSRRMVRDAKARAANCRRQHRFRMKNCNADVTPMSQHSSSSSSSSASAVGEEPPPHSDSVKAKAAKVKAILEKQRC
jgi:hypothetical protein